MRKRISLVAKKLIEKYNTRCPYELADHLGIEVFEFPFKNIRGLILRLSDNRRAIGIKNNLSYAEKKVIVAHEIGHYELHPASAGYFFIKEHTYFEPGKFECEANEFAAALLLDKPPESGETTVAYADRLEVSVDLIKYKLREVFLCQKENL